MIDITLIREKPDWVKEQIHKLHDENAVSRIDEIHGLDQMRRDVLQTLEELRGQRNKLSKGAGQLRGNKKVELGVRMARAQQVLTSLEGDDYNAAVAAFEADIDPVDADEDAFQKTMNAIFALMKDYGNLISELEERLTHIESQLDEHMLWVPNIPHESVPVAESEDANVPHAVQGQMPDFDFEPQPHWELGPALGLIEFERGVKLGGTRFYILNGIGAQLQRALINFLLDELIHEHHFQEMYVPMMVKEEAMYGSGQFPKFTDVAYRLEENGAYMIPTAEVALANMFGGEFIPEADLPMRYVAHTPCFRKEKMSAGRDVRGIKRVHQFEKVEMFVFAHPDNSYKIMEAMTRTAEGLCQKLEIPYRLLEIVTGDLGFTATKKYDIEMWAPGAQEWLEVSSVSNTEAFQARRASIKYRQEDKKTDYVHMLNGSALGIPRTLIAIMENYQTADGCIRVPQVLQPYMRGLEIIEPGT